MPFGLTNAPATFKRALDIILSGVKWQRCLIYLEDVIVYSKSEEEHIGDDDHVLRLLREAGVTLRLPKCRFFRTTVEYLGREIQLGRLGVMDAHTRALREAHFPTTRTQVRSFVGMCNVFRRFVPSFARMAAPLTDLMGSTAPVLVPPATPLQQQAFDRLKGALMTRAFQNSGFSAESGIYPDISGYIRWNILAIQCESQTEDTAGKLTSCSGSSWKD